MNPYTKRCANPFVRDDPRTITCDRPKGHSGKHLARWVSFDNEGGADHV